MDDLTHSRSAAKYAASVGRKGAPLDMVAAALRDEDRLLHAGIGNLTFGISPNSLFQAWQDWALHLSIAPGKQRQIQTKAIGKLIRLTLFILKCAYLKSESALCIEPLPQDRRFAAPEWQSPPFNVYHQSFLLWQQWWHNILADVPGVSRKHEQLVDFYGRQMLDMTSPSNFAATNPEVLRRAVETFGGNFLVGYVNFLEDLTRAAMNLQPAAADYFRPGVNVALTPGDVVHRNELMELIRYRPAATPVSGQPILIVPAWIMKYYILDLSPRNSLIRYLVDQGFEVFCMSWRNPGREQRDWSLDDYLSKGLMEALDIIVPKASGRKVHAVGYCLGGTLLAIAAAAMARDGDDRLRALTLLAALVDFEEPGELGLFIDESQLSMLEDIMWNEGFLDQRRMAGVFQMLKSQDLLWSRIVRDYLMGERTPMTDIMAWNLDATRLPYRMHSEYLRRLYLDNDLAQGRYHVAGRPVHLEDIHAPVFAVGTVADHIAPWQSVFKLTDVLDADVDFILTSGGHNSGIVSDPDVPRWAYRHLRFRQGDRRPDAQLWVQSAEEIAGPWWPAWVGWLKSQSAEDVAARSAVARTFRKLGPAPGTYVVTT